MSPRLNLASLVLLVAATVSFEFLRRLDNSGISSVSLLGDGGIYGVALGWCWVTSVTRRRWISFFVKVLIICLFSYLLRESSKAAGDWLRYATQLGGMIVTQSVLFHLLDVPKWQWNVGASTSDSKQIEPTRQFGILDVMLVTLAYGSLMALARHYMPPVSLGEYWPTAIVLSVFFPTLATIVAHSGRLGKRRHAFSRILLLGLLVGLGASGLGWIEARIFLLDFDQAKAVFIFYLLFSVGFVIATGIFAFAGVFGHLFLSSKLPSYR